MLKRIFDPEFEIDINSTTVLFSVLLLHLVGPQAMITQPAFVDGLVNQLNFDASQAGYVAASENFGKAVQSLLMMFLITRVNWRYLFYVALGVLILGNFVCTLISSFEAFRVTRFFTGMATGTIVPLCYVVVGLTAKSSRNFGLLMVTVMSYAAVVFVAVPSVFETLGFTGLVTFYALFSLLGLFAVRHMPTVGTTQNDSAATGVTLSWTYRIMALGAMFVYFIALFSVWAYMSLIGQDVGLTDQQIANALTVAQFAGIAGALSVIALGDRFGRALPLLLALGGSIVSIFIMGNYRMALGFTVAAALFNFFWNLGHPFLLAAHASFDQSGRQVTYATAMQMMGIAAGPAIAAAILTDGSFNQVLLLSTVGMLVAIALIQPPVIKEKALSKKQTGALERTSNEAAR